MRELIQELAGTRRSTFAAMLCKVLSVDVGDKTADVEPLNGEADMFDVRFRASLSSDSGFFAVPKVGSAVLVIKTSDVSGCIVLASEVEKIFLVTEGQDNEGLVRVNYLFSRLRAIEQYCTQLNTLLTTHVHPSAGAVSPQLVAPAMPNAGTSVKNDLMNPNVIH